LTKAKLFEVKWQPKKATPNKVNGANDVEVQFNPQTLKLTYANENKNANSPGGSASQYVGNGTTKLAVELVFDTSQTGKDVRYWSAKVGYFMKPSPQPNQSNKRVPPGVSFEWGSFVFPGIVDSLTETLDYFSEDGIPLRTTIALGISRLDISFPDLKPPGTAASGEPGTKPLTQARAGDNIPKVAGRNDNSANWKSVAAANNIDDPLRVPAGTMIDPTAGAAGGSGIGAGIGIGGGIGASAGIGASGGASAGFSAGLGGGIGFSAGASAGIGASASIGVSAGVGVSAGAGVGASAGVAASAGFGASAGIGASAGFGATASASASAGGGARANAAGSAGGSFGVGASAGASAGLALRAG
jgi:hypothetical protein